MCHGERNTEPLVSEVEGVSTDSLPNMFTIKTFITSNRDYRFLVEDPSSYLFSGLQRANSLKPDNSVSDANIKKSETAGCTYQSDKDAEELNHISINH